MGATNTTTNTREIQTDYQIYELMGVATEVERNLPGPTIVTKRVDTVFKVVTIINIVTISTMLISKVRLSPSKLTIFNIQIYSSVPFVLLKLCGVTKICHAKRWLLKVFLVREGVKKRLVNGQAELRNVTNMADISV